MQLKPAVFLDRDGVINKDRGYVSNISDFEWVDGSKEGIKFLNDKNYYVFVVTNQSGLSKGLYTIEDVHSLHMYINDELNKINAYIDEFFVSPYHPDIPGKYKELAHLRKPEVGMLKLAESRWNIKKDQSFLIGDKTTDIDCAVNYGIRGHLFNNSNLLDFINKILK